MSEETEVSKLKDTVRRLNRRCQKAEAAAGQNVDDCRRAGVSFGRILANWAATDVVKKDKLLVWIQENEVEIEEDNCYPKEMIYVYDLKEYLGVKP